MTITLGFAILIATGIALFITEGADKRNEYRKYKNDGQ